MSINFMKTTRRIFIVFLLELFAFIVIPLRTHAQDFTNLQNLSDKEFRGKIKIFKSSKAELDLVLAELHRRFSDHSSRLKAIAAMYTGAPYNLDPLENESTDWLPYGKTNCTMFVLYATAFAAGRSYHEALQHMRWLHYKGAAVGYTTRYHFTTDRITDSASRYFSDVTQQYVHNPAVLKQVTVTLNKKKDGNYFFNGRLDNWSHRVTVNYLPRAGFSPEMLKELPSVLGTAMVKKSHWEKGIIIGHEGLLIDGDLYHSSQKSGVCVVKDYLASTFPDSQWEGLVLFAIYDIALPQ